MWIVRNGAAKCSFNVTPDADEDVRAAAADLVRVVKKASGAALPRRKPRTGEGEIRLMVDPSIARRVRRSLPPCDAFRITCKGSVLEIAGARPRAVAYGVYQLLEETAGARWFFPDPLGEDIPPKKDISRPAGSRVYEPSLAWRSVGHNVPKDWSLRQKLEYFPVSGGHAYHDLLPESLFKERPEFFSMIYGKRRAKPSQICHSAPGLVDRALEYVEEQVRQKPAAQAISFCPGDFGFFCECDACRAMDDVTRHYDFFVHEPPYGYGGPVAEAHLSERVFDFTNRVAERVAKTHPDKFLICFAYGGYRFPPQGFRIRDNVIVWLAHTCVGMFNRERREAEIAFFRLWRKAAKHVVIFEAMANQCWPCLPREVSPLAEEQLKLLKAHGIEGYYSQMWGDWATNLPSYYVATRLTWDASRDGRAELREMYRRAFGPAARHVAAYFQVFQDAWRRKTEDGSLPWARSVIATKRQFGICHAVFTGQVMIAARAALERAKVAAPQGTFARRVEFIAAGFRYTELMMDAIHECVALEDMNLPLFYPAPWLAPPYPYDFVKVLLLGQCDRRVVAHGCRRALAAFDRVEKYVKQYEGRHVLSPDILRRSKSPRVREILSNILKLAEAKTPDRDLERKMFVTHEL